MTREGLIPSCNADVCASWLVRYAAQAFSRTLTMSPTTILTSFSSSPSAMTRMNGSVPDLRIEQAAGFGEAGLAVFDRRRHFLRFPAV